MHTVAKGDSLWEIAKQTLGDGERLNDILSLNPTLVKHPDLIYPGQIIKLPAAKP
ncbi:MAG: LysM peptidoglycan-binding domain-containing protein [Pararhizobium sp.]|nr:LysM peptidoglycan-binding domain-containing protein [Pararhizobium sp.]